ncbi:hypothetical protein ACO9S2_17360 [Nitrospira sp. NS4]|uniref:hypothetical protein n=1 Tax=Nitrospira sp. NS4 TaxID=3414498 RepID=UPI003C2EF6DC
MFPRQTTASLLWLAAIAAIPVAGYGADAPSERIEIAGDYRYAAHESEPVDEAKALACKEAWRLAVVNSPLYREQTASVIDSALLRDLAYTLATQHVQDGQTVEQLERGRTVSCRVQGFLPVEESTRIIKTALAGGPPSAEWLDQNRVLRIVSIREDKSGTIVVQYEALTRLDWIGTHYQGGLRESADIMVDFYDDQGILLRTDRYPARRTSAGDDILNPGSVAMLKIAKPMAAKTYRVWLVK